MEKSSYDAASILGKLLFYRGGVGSAMGRAGGHTPASTTDWARRQMAARYEEMESRMNLINATDLIGANVTGVDGTKLRKVEDVYVDAATDRPEWVVVKTGMLASHVSLIPLAEASQHDGELRVPYDKALVKEAPHQEPGQELDPAEEAELFRYCGIPYGGETVTAEPGMETTASPSTPTDDAMIRSEEQLRVGTQRSSAGQFRLRKYIVTENVTQTVPVSHEEIRIERVPIAEATAAKL